MSEFCKQLHLLFSKTPIFQFPFDSNKIPLNGIYVLFEDGEVAHNVNRIVRVGTHTGKDQLRSRLSQHFIQENKDRSIFRKNIGRAILSRDHDPFIISWDLDLTTRKAKGEHRGSVDFERQSAVEKMVSSYIQEHFRFATIEILNESERLQFESKMISTVSKCDECKPSASWLGLYSPKEKIRKSGLWLVNELYKEPLTHNEFEKLRGYLEKV